MLEIPRDKNLDSTLALFLDPYEFISKRCRNYDSDIFETRLLLQKTICMTGPEAAELFYQPDSFVRQGAAPGRIQKTLFGQGGVQGLDDEAHQHRKKMFMSLMTTERINSLRELTAYWLQTYARKWATTEQVVLYNELHEILTRAVCTWAGVPLEDSEVCRRTGQLTALFDYAGSIGPKHWWSRVARKQSESWAEAIIEKIRAEQLSPSEHSAAHIIATHRDLNGKLLPSHVAAVEILNILRPTVAVSVFITFVAHALYKYPDCRERLCSDSGYTEPFVQEVRRFYPFFPSVLAKIRHDFEWKGYRFPQGRRVMLDLYGTNHDPRTWEVPGEFRPERFQERKECPYSFIPQGGGEHHRNHRCPGEWIAVELMKTACEFLVGRLVYKIPEQNLGIDFSRLPALPKSRFIMSHVKPKNEA